MSSFARCTSPRLKASGLFQRKRRCHENPPANRCVVVHFVFVLFKHSTCPNQARRIRTFEKRPARSTAKNRSRLKESWAPAGRPAHLREERRRSSRPGFVCSGSLVQLDLWRASTSANSRAFRPRRGGADTFARLLLYRGDMMPSEKLSPYARRSPSRSAERHQRHQAPRQVADRISILGYQPSTWQPEDILGRMSGIVVFPLTDEAARHHPRALGPEKGHVDATDPQPFRAKASTRARRGFSKPSSLRSVQFAIDEREQQPGRRGHRVRRLMFTATRTAHRTARVTVSRALTPGWNATALVNLACPGCAGHNDRIAWGNHRRHRSGTSVEKRTGQSTAMGGRRRVER